jgi:hypothetical protein
MKDKKNNNEKESHRNSNPKVHVGLLGMITCFSARKLTSPSGEATKTLRFYNQNSNSTSLMSGRRDE